MVSDMDVARAGRLLAEELDDENVEVPVVSLGTVTAVSNARCTVSVQGGSLEDIPMTTACLGVRVGSRVVVETSRRISVVTGVIGSDWTMPRQTTLTGYPTSGGFARFDLRRMGDLVCCYSTMNNITGDGFNSLNLTVPVGWRPPHGELPPVLMRTDRTANEVVLNVDTNNGYKITYYSGISTVNTYHTGFGLWKTHDYL